MSLFKTWTGQSQRSQKSQQSDQYSPAPATTTATATADLYASRSDLQRVTTNTSNADPFAGHLNHLTEQQELQLQRFRLALQEQGLYSPAAQGQPASHDDQTLLRYLRARKFELKGALAQFDDTKKWSQENRITELYEEFDVEFYEKARRMYPQWTGHRDKRGIPVYVYVIKHIDSKNVNSYAKEAAAYKAKLPLHSSLSSPAKMLPLFALYENLTRFTMPLCSTLERPNPEVPITNSSNIVDISGVGLKQFWNLKSHMQESSVLATSHYPETLDRIFIIGAPSFFPTVWGWVKRWFDPVTVRKISIIPPHEVKSRLSEYIHPDDFPKKYGGNLDWDVGMSPDLDQAAREAVESNGSKGWIEGPCLWIQNQRVPVGTVGGKPRRPAKLEQIPVRVEAEISVAQPAPATEAAELAQVLDPPMSVQPESTQVSNPPSMAHSGSTASNLVATPPEASTLPIANGTAQLLDSEAPIVANGEVLRAGAVKPPMERFVTAFEDLHTTPTQVDSKA